MRLRDIIICCVCIVLAAGLLIASASQLDYINNQREKLHLVMERPENLPPSLAFVTVATGAFRGLVVDILWMRADKLKEQKQFFDAKQLAEWITILQPRFPAVWVFQSWNMAYNISVAIPASQYDQRWRWVKNGYELLRDQAIGKYKLKNIEVYRELATIFQHKIGGLTDESHEYYKLQLALSMEPLLGKEPDNKYFDDLCAAPGRIQDAAADPNMAGFIKALKDADDAFADEDEFVSNYFALFEDPNKFAPAAGRVIEDFRNTKALEKFDIFACAWQLRNVWKLEPETMRELNQTYGPVDWIDPNTRLPLDWRHPDCHAIYWAVMGLRANSQRPVSADQTNTDRMVGHSLQNLFRYGKIVIYDVVKESNDPVLGVTQQLYKDIYLRPELRMFESYNRSMLATLNEYKDKTSEGEYQSLGDGHRNMLINAVLSFYQSGHESQAQKIFNELRKLYPREEFNVSLMTFAKNRLLEELQILGITDVREQIEMMLVDSYYLYAIRQDDDSYGREKMVQEIYAEYKKRYEDAKERLALPELSRLRLLALQTFLEGQQFPAYLRNAFMNRMATERPELYKQLAAEQEKLNKEIQEKPK
jgi:hypothetical protein